MACQKQAHTHTHTETFHTHKHTQSQQSQTKHIGRNPQTQTATAQAVLRTSAPNKGTRIQSSSFLLASFRLSQQSRLLCAALWPECETGREGVCDDGGGQRSCFLSLLSKGRKETRGIKEKDSEERDAIQYINCVCVCLCVLYIKMYIIL